MDLIKRINQIANQVGDLITDEARSQVEVASALLEKKEFSAAIFELTNVLEKRPDHGRALYLLGLCYQNRNMPGDRELAKQKLEQALVVNAHLFEPYLLLGQLYEEDLQFEKARVCYETALTTNRDTKFGSECEFRLGKLYYSQKRYSQAIRELQKILKRQTYSLEVLGLLGLAFYEKAKESQGWEQKETLQKAVDFLERAVVQNSTSTDVWFAYGEGLQQQGKWEKSEQILQEGMIRFPENSKLLLLLAKYDQQQGKWNKSQESILKIFSFQQKEIGNALIYQMLAVCEEKMGFPEKALDTYEKAIKELSTDSWVDQRSLWQEAFLLACRYDLVERAIFMAKYSKEQDIAEVLAFQALDSAVTLEDAEKLLNKALSQVQEPLNQMLQGPFLIALASAYFYKKNQGVSSSIIWLKKAALLLPQERTPQRWLDIWTQEVYQQIPNEWNPILQGIDVFFQNQPSLQSFLPQLHEITSCFSAPLTIAIAGEFNAGKSTFLNAWLGEEIFKSGITPTTAFVQKLVYSKEKTSVIFYKDGSKKELSHEEWVAENNSLVNKRSSEIAWVEVGYPIEILKRVHLVDTPGFNSLDLDHEKRTQEFLLQADAIIWIFSVHQAGKETEKEVLHWLWQHGNQEIIGVLNKIDRLTALTQEQASSEEATENALAAISSFLRSDPQGVGAFLKEIIPFSAKDALLGKKYEDPQFLQKSGMLEVQNIIEERFISRTLEIKKNKATKQLRLLLDEAMDKVRMLQSQQQQPNEMMRILVEKLEQGLRDLMGIEKKWLLQELRTVYQTLAQDILGFIRPGRFILGENEVTSFDRDYILERSKKLLDNVVLNSKNRIENTLKKEVYEPYFSAEIYFFTQEIVAICQKYRSFMDGYLLGGKLDEFCYQILPKLECNELAITRILEQKFPTTLELLEREFFFPVKNVWHSFLAKVQRQQFRQEGEYNWMQSEIEICLQKPLFSFITILK